MTVAQEAVGGGGWLGRERRGQVCEILIENGRGRKVIGFSRSENSPLYHLLATKVLLI